MSNDTPIVITWHEENLSKFKLSQNGSRNVTMNQYAFSSFGLALGNSEILSVSKVESDYTAAAKALQMDDSSIKATLTSALSAANPRDAFPDAPRTDKPIDKSKLIVAPTYSALEDYAVDHGVLVEVFERAKWEESTHNNRKCFKVPHEDKVIRARFIDGEQPKWIPIKTDDKKITPCFYGFDKAVAMAAKSDNKTIVLCNGQPSVVVALSHGIPALAQTDGENKAITKPLFKRLQEAIAQHGLSVLLVYDGDDTGRKSNKRVKEQLQANKINVRFVQFGGDDGYDLADYCKEHTTGVMDKLLRLAAYSDRRSQPVLSRKQLAVTTRGQVMNPTKHIPPGELLVSPFKSFHKLGGFAYLHEPQKMTMVLSPSGGGKTSLLETWQDIWNMLGIDTMFFSPEWSPISLQHRSIQRYTGILTKVIKLHLLWEKERQRGIPEKQRHGIQMIPGSEQYKNYLYWNDKISKWPGVAYAFQGQKATGDILEAMSKQLYLLRRSDRRIGVAMFDYAQLMRPDNTEDDRNRYESICDDIKQWCNDNWIHAVVGSQPTKAVGNASRKGEKILDEYDSHWVRPDAFNLIVTLNVKEVEKFKDGVGTGEMEKEPHGIVNICKNNEGEQGQVKLLANFRHLAWQEIV